jgi:hypothetical protein
MSFQVELELAEARAEIDKLTEERDELIWRLEEAAEKGRQESYHNMQSGTRG